MRQLLCLLKVQKVKGPDLSEKSRRCESKVETDEMSNLQRLWVYHNVDVSPAKRNLCPHAWKRRWYLRKRSTPYSSTHILPSWTSFTTSCPVSHSDYAVMSWGNKEGSSYSEFPGIERQMNRFNHSTQKCSTHCSWWDDEVNVWMWMLTSSLLLMLDKK